MNIPPRAKIRSVVQVGLTIILLATCLPVVFLSLGTVSAQKFAAASLGAVIGYWFR